MPSAALVSSGKEVDGSEPHREIVVDLHLFTAVSHI